MAVYVQYGKVGKPILYTTLPTASADLKDVIGQVGDEVFQCDGTQWVALALPANLEEKTITITENGTTELTPSTNYDGISKAIITTNVPSTPTEEKTVDLDMESGNQIITPTNGKVLSKVTITKPTTFIAENIKKDISIGGITGAYEGVTLPTYGGLLRFSSSPTISLTDSTLTITAVENATSYDIYSNDTLLTNTTNLTVDLSTLITETGTYTIYAIAKATNYADSEKSNEISYTESGGYSVSCSSYGSKESEDLLLYTYYSTDNGSTWTEFTSAGVLAEDASQIKFKLAKTSDRAPGFNYITSIQLGMSLELDSSVRGSTEVVSDNYTLTQNIDDITTEFLIGKHND